MNLIERPIAVFDSGVGGLTVAAELYRRFPHEKFVFFADRARVPYASLSPALITRYAVESAQFLATLEPKAYVIACNTVSSVALTEVERAVDAPVVNVLRPTAEEAARVTRTRRIGVIATTATAKRGTYDAALRELLGDDVFVASQGCPLFVPLVEEGWTTGDIPHRVAEHYLAPLRRERLDTLILGCTHYEYFRDIIQLLMGPDVELVHTPSVTAAALGAELDRLELRAEPGSGGIHIFSSDVTDALIRVSTSLFGPQIVSRIEAVTLEQLTRRPVHS